MAEVPCVDGTMLGVLPVPVVDRHGAPYEMTLQLLRDGADFGSVGERCGYFLAATCARLSAAGDFPASSVEGGLRAWAADDGRDPDVAWGELVRYVPRDHELFAFRRREPDDIASVGELRCTVQTQRSWVEATGQAGAGGRWRLERRAVLDAWGDHGVGVRAVLDVAGLTALLDALLTEAAALGMLYDPGDIGSALRRPAG